MTTPPPPQENDAPVHADSPTTLGGVEQLVGPWYLKLGGKVSGPFPIVSIMKLPNHDGLYVGNADRTEWLPAMKFKNAYSVRLMARFEDYLSRKSADSRIAKGNSVLGSGTHQIDEHSLGNIMREVNSMIGMSRAKSELTQSIALIRTALQRNESGLATELGSFNAVFSGNPGTGKTTFARLYAKALKALGVCKNAEVREASRSDLIAGYSGQTALKTQDVIKTALGGVLFIDEAYALVSDERDSYGQEALAELIKVMEDKRSELVVVMAGYTQDMQGLLSVNPGLRSRMLSTIHFDDYSDKELVQIARTIISSRKYKLEPAVDDELLKLFGQIRQSVEQRAFGNAREARNVVDRMIRAHAIRMLHTSNPSKEQLQLLTLEDIVGV